MRLALLATGLLAVAARLTVLADAGTVANMTTMAVVIVAAMGYVVSSILD
jgi:hypothetical protein